MLKMYEIKELLAKSDNLAEIGRETGYTRAYLSAVKKDTDNKLNPSSEFSEKLSDYFEGKK